MDKLDGASKAKLPTLLALRDALYSQEFRDFVSEVTGEARQRGRGLCAPCPQAGSLGGGPPLPAKLRQLPHVRKRCLAEAAKAACPCTAATSCPAENK